MTEDADSRVKLEDEIIAAKSVYDVDVARGKVEVYLTLHNGLKD